MFMKRFKIKKLTKKLTTMQQNRLHAQPRDEIIVKEIAYYHELAKIYHSLIGHQSHPFAAEMENACLRAAASLDDVIAQYELGKKLLDKAKFCEKLQQDGLFASATNKQKMTHLYEDALAYLKSADKHDNVQARRLLGLCYIHGWGVASNQDKGFELVVSSIELENSWEKMTQIFEEIGLNKPEYVSALMKHREKGKKHVPD